MRSGALAVGRILSACLLLACGTAPLRAQRVVYVNQAATGANNGTNWADAYRELRVALSNAVGGDQIWVASGTYKPTSGTDRDATFRLVSGVTLYGGFAGT